MPRFVVLIHVSVASPKAAPATATRRWMARNIQRNLEDGHSCRARQIYCRPAAPSAGRAATSVPAGVYAISATAPSAERRDYSTSVVNITLAHPTFLIWRLLWLANAPGWNG